MTWPDHAFQRTQPSRRGCNRAPSWAGSLSLGLYECCRLSDSGAGEGSGKSGGCLAAAEHGAVN